MNMLICLKVFLISMVAVSAMSILSLRSAALLVQSLCAATDAMKRGNGPTGSEMELAEAYVRRHKLVPARFAGRASRKMLAIFDKYAA